MAVIDIVCPSCGRSGPTRKVRIGAYRCTACDHEFGLEAIDPVEQSDEGTRR